MARRGGAYLICETVHGLWGRSGYAVRGKRTDFSSSSFAIGFGPEGRELDMTRVQIEEKRLKTETWDQLVVRGTGEECAYVTKATSWTLITFPSPIFSSWYPGTLASLLFDIG